MTQAPKWNLLTDPIIPADTVGGRVETTLPGLLAMMSSGECRGPSKMMRHQEPALHMFLVQIAAASLSAMGRPSLCSSKDEWASAILSLGPENAWNLVPEAASEPGFLQAPMPAEDIEAFGMVEFPDELSTLKSVSKNHAIKRRRIRNATPWSWACSMIELQTMSGGNGRGHRGIARIDSDFGSRLMVSYATGHTFADRWKRDTLVAVKRRQESFRICPALKRSGGLVLTWLEAWDGRSQIDVAKLDPFFIEICRRVRLVDDEGSIVAKVGTSNATRIAAAGMKGVIGDVFAPLDAKNGKVARITDRGWTYDVMADMIVGGGGIVPSTMMSPDPSDVGPGCVVAKALVGGKGKTGGYHEREVEIPARVRSRLFGGAGSEVGDMSKSMVSDASEMWGRAVLPAIMCFYQGGPEKLDPKDKASKEKASSWESVYTSNIDEIFFGCLWGLVEGKSRKEAWLDSLLSAGMATLRQAQASRPTGFDVFLRSSVRSDRILRGSAYKMFEELRPKKEKNSDG